MSAPSSEPRQSPAAPAPTPVPHADAATRADTGPTPENASRADIDPHADAATCANTGPTPENASRADTDLHADAATPGAALHGPASPPADATTRAVVNAPADTAARAAANAPADANLRPDTTPRSPAAPPGGLLAWFAAQPPAAGSAVMATGIISVGLRQVGATVLSSITFALAALLWLVLADDFGRRLLWQRQRWTSESQTPPALTGVASTTVLGVRVSLEGWQAVAVGLLIVATLVWPLLLWSVLRHLRPNMPGAVFLICVATQGMATLSAVLAAALPARWLLWPALALFVLGLVLYVDALMHFDVAAVRDGAGDHWVAGGALAISALACAKLTAAKSLTGTVHSTLRVTALVLVALAWTWYVVLAVAEVRWPRPRYDVRRWATIFPMGMTGAATSEVATATGWHQLTGLGHTLVWIAAAAWLLVFAGLLREAGGRLRKDDGLLHHTR